MLNTTQLRILRLILQSSDLHFTAIAQQLKLTPMAISKAVTDLENKDFVAITAVGKSKIVRVKLNEDHLEYYSLAEKLEQKHPLIEVLKTRQFEFAILTKEETIVVSDKKIPNTTTITLDEFKNSIRKYERILKGERVILKPYNFWKVMT